MANRSNNAVVRPSNQPPVITAKSKVPDDQSNRHASQQNLPKYAIKTNGLK
jgi:hypothetical protein